MRVGEPCLASKLERRQVDSRKLWTNLESGHYRNPIIPADYSDPDVIRHGDEFFLTSSSFNCTPGLPVLHSRDLVNWTIINHALRNLPERRYERVQAGCGIWAPSMRFHDGKFWIVFPMPDEGIYVVSANDPFGEWTRPHLVTAGKGLIDPCPLWDDDGNAYFVHAFAYSRSGVRNRLRICPMAPDCSQLLEEGHVVFENADKHPILEGPKFLKKDGWYYILAPAGGVATGWQVALRSRHIYGPYEDRIVLEQGMASINGPHQGALVDTNNGEWWFIHFQEVSPYGRILHLQPVTWKDEWPFIGLDEDGNGVGEPVLIFRKPDIVHSAPLLEIQTTDEFDSQCLGRQWQWNANHRMDWYSLSAEPGWLRLLAQPVPDGKIDSAPHLLTQKLPAHMFTATTCLRLPPDADANTRSGLVVVGQTSAGLLVSLENGDLRIEHFQCVDLETGNMEISASRIVRSEQELTLRVKVREDAECEFSYSLDGFEFNSLGSLFRATPGNWIGARVGIVCIGENAYADFDYFRVT